MNVAIVALYGIENTGVRSISAVLRNNGFPVYEIFFKRWLNNDIRPPTHKERSLLVSLLRELKVDMVGFSLTSPFLKIAAELTFMVKKELPVTVVWGGIHATVRAEECLEHADIVCRGEGELAMLELAGLKSPLVQPSGVKNTVYRSGKNVVVEDMRPLIQELDTLPLYDYSGGNKFFIENNRVNNIDPLVFVREFRVLASRGCPFNCSYCYNSILRRLYRGQKYHRLKSPARVMSEIENARDQFPLIRRIKFDDDTFVFPHPWIDDFCRQYQKRVNIPFGILFNADCIDTGILKKLYHAGLRYAQVGVQSGSVRESGEIYNRDLSHDNILKFARLAAELRLEVVYDVILDNPAADFSQKIALVDFLLALPRPFNLFVYSLIIFPGTELCLLLQEKGLISADDIEGRATKSFRQFRAGFSYPRSRDDLFVLCLVSLVSKSFIPKSLVRSMMGSRFLREHPFILKWLAYSANLIKLFQILTRMLLRGEVGLWKFQEYGIPRRFLVQ